MNGKSIMDFIIWPIVVVALIVGGYFVNQKSDKVDSPVEQVIEGALKTQGVDIDFSADKKKAQQEELAKNSNSVKVESKDNQ